ncbi:hypothetical protein NMG60_11031751 [Bertholletia excelsa]
MARESSSNDLQSLLEAITSSDVVESRVQLLNRVLELDISEEYDLSTLIQFLNVLWEDFTCLDISQCMLNKTILHVAAKYLGSEISGCLRHFLDLGIKAGAWCEKHLKVTLMSTEDSQEEEHFHVFFQLLLDLISYSASSFSAMARYPISNDKELMVVVVKFTSELLHLTKGAISEIKRVQAFGLEVLKATQVVLDAVIRLCKVYSSAVKWDFPDVKSETEENSIDCQESDAVQHVIDLTKCTIEQLCELGTLAANDGGNLVTLLNLSWKGVVGLLQLGKGRLAVKLNVADIILILISLANESLRCAAETWSSCNDIVPASDAKRIFLPVKFYLINAVRISSLYPCQAFSVHKDITLCVLVISTFRILLGKQEVLKSTSQVLAELLEPTSFHFLNSLLNSTQLKQDEKFQILDCLFHDGSDLNFIAGDPSSISMSGAANICVIFSLTKDNMNGARILLLTRFNLYLNLLKSAPDVEEDVRLGLARKLQWLLNVLVDEEVYSSCLVLPIHSPIGSGKATELACQPTFFSVLHALKTFMAVLCSSQSWEEMESFLLENFFHPHFLCWEVVMELWCFMMRHAELVMVNDVIDKLCLLFRCMTSSESVLVPGSALRKFARSICRLLMHASQSTVDRVYGAIIDSKRSQSSSTAFVALLVEGFPLHMLSDKIKRTATQRILTEYFEFMECFDDESQKACHSGVFGAPVFALSASLQSLQGSSSSIDVNTLKFLVTVINVYKNTSNSFMRDHYRKLLSETLGIISNIKHLYASDVMDEVILELQNLFICGQPASDRLLYQCKPNLATFMASLGHSELEENESSAKSSAVWELFHLLLREQHWAFIHLAITAFGYFAARTSCNQLWRFVPQNAALSFDLESHESNEERFMSELKAFLEKEAAALTMTPSFDQIQLLVKEGLMLKEIIQKGQNIIAQNMGCENMEIDSENCSNKRRKLPDAICQGVELLQNGLKVIVDGLPQLQQNNFDNAELHDKFLTHFSHLEDVIGHLVGLAGGG